MKTETTITLIVSLAIVAVFGLMTNCSIQVARTSAVELCRERGGYWDELKSECFGGRRP